MKRVAVVGSSGGIGAAIVKELAGLGYSLVGLDQVTSPPPHPRDLADFINVDLRDPEDVNLACLRLREGREAFWGIVYCAGVYPIVRFADYTLGLWGEVEAVNVRAAFQICQGLGEVIERGGRIVLISSGAAHVGSRDVCYSVTKAGLIGLMKSLARTLGEQGILVNAICPGVIRSSMSARMKAADIRDYLRRRIVLRRLGEPSEVAICVAFLLDERNSYMTGATLDVNGGLYAR